jgi:hypothetical protein
MQSMSIDRKSICRVTRGYHTRSHLGLQGPTGSQLRERATGGSNAKLEVAQAELGTLLLKIVDPKLHCPPSSSEICFYFIRDTELVIIWEVSFCHEFG